ncbi:ABA4-like family protein [uncultured Arcticibacterium sp.]|uniref:ABA4-like family protein n=1 Tax=uncultured Arcticibacterium sp. TaxID=2173042 RepID=UPI0030FCEF61
MTPSSIFSFGNSFVILGWLLLLILPHWKYTQTLVLNGVILLLSLIYAFMVISDLGSFEADSFNSLASVKALFTSDTAIVIGWFHYLAFDLFVGAYVVRKSKETGLARWIYSLILPFVFMFGPVGYLIFVIAKTVKTRSLME